MILRNLATQLHVGHVTNHLAQQDFSSADLCCAQIYLTQHMIVQPVKQ